MTRDEKIAFYNQLAELEQAVLAINGPYAQTKAVLSKLEAFRGAWLDDEVFHDCEGCEEPIFESEMETASSNEDGSWFCASCLARWNIAHSEPPKGKGDV